ncbi:Nramp family divalent metal transporter [Kineococcus sp. SYSU DK003]|uniref:Nramp family divalent metal transporter n=1 Tax=Kineococcus sp. SYSU DK003 TaxID=3383124 RepID=UPI003D7D41D9
MSESTLPRNGSVDQLPDPYRLRIEDAMEPPTTLAGRAKFLGPGLILSAAVVGSGELITTTALGARAGFVLLWLVVISTAVKVWVQLELARWAILKGRTALEGYSEVGPRIGRISWINVLWIGMDFAKMLQRGGIIGGAVTACSILLPLVGEPLGFASLVTWTVIILTATVTLVYTNRYSIIERVALAAIVLTTLATVAMAIGLPFSEFSYGTGELASGLSFAIPAGTLGIAVAMFGLTGVGADEMTTYTYWCLEKGYARWTGPDDGTEERARRAEGWLKVLRLDVLVSWIVCTLCTLSFYVIGAAVLHPQGLVPSGTDMITTLARVWSDVLGSWASPVFLFAAAVILAKTFLTSCASVPRLWTNTLGLLGVIDWHDPVQRQKTLRILTLVLPPIWAVSFLFIQSPVLMVQIGGISSGIFLVAVVIATWHLRRQVEARFRDGAFVTTMLVLSSSAISLLGVYTVLQVFGVEIS